VLIEQRDCVEGMLPKMSVVKMTKILTIHSSLVIKKICALRPERLETRSGGFAEKLGAAATKAATS